MADRSTRLVIDDLRGGRNGIDPPTSLKETQCVDAVNVEWYQTRLGRKRKGLTRAGTSFGSGGPFTDVISSVFRHVPGTDDSAAEQWAVDADAVIGRRAASTSFVAPTLKDAISSNGWDVDWATLNGKLFIAYAAGSGFTAPSAPTVANTGAGSYAAVLRYYRVRWIQQVGGVTIRRSPVGTSQSFTPSGTGTAARVTRPAVPSQGETHWELEVSYDNSTFRVLYGDGGIYAPIAIATTTGDDSSTTSSTTIIDTLTASSGTWTPPLWVSSVSYLLVGGGGGGGGDDAALSGGGGGGGRVKTGTSAVTGGSSYSYTIGAGGAGGAAAGSQSGAAGGSTTWNSITAEGGSGGGGSSSAGSGGTIGGGGGESQAAGSGTVHSGGAGATNAGGGGGGAGADGTAGASGAGGNGGAGTSSSISGSSVEYGGGGGGAGLDTGGTATGGGGNGGAGVSGGSAGTVYRGGGGGGGRFGNAGGDGGSGVIILSYASLNISSAGTSNADNTDRLHVWDGSTVRRAGFVTPGACTVANTGAGAYAATIRYYRTRWTEQSGGVTIRRSEPSASTSFTPSGAGTAARVTRPTAAGEGETHWELEASSDGTTFYLLATTAIATTTYDDSATVSTYSSGTVSALTGTYTPQKSYRFIAADQGRLLGFGNFTATSRQNDIEVSAVVGSLNVGDAERVDTTQTYRYTLDESDSGKPTGLRGPLFGNFYAFKWAQFWELSPTGIASNPYRRTPISKTIGCVGRTASCLGEDEASNPCLYFWSPQRGLYRYGVGGMLYIGTGVEDYVLGPTATINLAATNVVATVLYYPAKRQVWCWWATGSSNDPNQGAIYDVRTGGWSRIPTGDTWANVRAAHLFSRTIGATMSLDLKPYLTSSTTAGRMYLADDGTQDDNVSYQAYVVTKPLEPGGPGANGSTGDAILLAPAASGVTITATAIPNFDSTVARTGTADLTATGSETRVTRRLQDSSCGNAAYVQYQIGDASAASAAWTLDRLVIPVKRDEGVS